MNCDNCEIEVPCAEDCKQCKRREESQESRESAEPVETANKIINKWPKWKKNIRCRPSLVNQEPAKKQDEFIKECYELLAKGATEEQWKFATKLRLACKRLEAAEKRAEGAVGLLDEAVGWLSHSTPTNAPKNYKEAWDDEIQRECIAYCKYEKAIALLKEKRK